MGICGVAVDSGWPERHKEGFPEYHNVYIEPGSYEIYKKTGEFPDGTILFKELQRVRKPSNFPTVRVRNLRAGVTSRANITAPT